MRWVRRLVLIALLVGFMVGGWQFAAENQEPVRVHYVAGEFTEHPLWQVILISFFAGAAIVGLYTMFSSAKNGLVSRRYRKAIGGLEAEVHQLRNLPLAPESEARALPGSTAQAEGALGQDG